jgi:lipopolysaccharide/colanic/teichoic acid biosynthesis glycosyltransferase
MALAFAISEPITAEITPSSIFQDTLSRERKRAERSGRPFMLALIHGACFQEATGKALAQAIGTSISSCIRVTDSLGWYEQDYTLGVLFTEIGEVDNAKLEPLSQKIFSAIRKTVTFEEFSRLRVAIRVLPHYAADGSLDDSWEELIYRELHHEPAMTTQAQALKRIVDIVGSCFFLIMLLPILIVICSLIKATSRGPVFFCQKRVGRYGKLFSFYKFRSMYADNDPTIHREYVTQLISGKARPQATNGMYKLVADPRVTPFGSILRKTSLDELPQFVNVLLGDMSLVGPRPPIPYEFACYRPWHKRRLIELKPGLTGVWQVQGRSTTTFDEMVRMDLHYARTQSLWLDLKIIVQTPAAMFLGRGAY